MNIRRCTLTRLSNTQPTNQSYFKINQSIKQEINDYHNVGKPFI